MIGLNSKCAAVSLIESNSKCEVVHLIGLHSKCEVRHLTFKKRWSEIGTQSLTNAAVFEVGFVTAKL
jgi:hypothetical protein